VSAFAAAHVVDAHVRPRAGLGDLSARLSGEDCTVAYLGASVTAQRDGYRPRLHELLRQTTGRAHRAVAAGAGAMGSITGVFLMDDLVLPHRPDLCFVEYTTSDVAGTTPLEHLGAALEGIVGKLRDAGCEAVFLHLYRSDLDLVDASPVVELYERVAEHLGVPSIDVGAGVRDLLRAGEIDESAVLRDVVHTTAAGSELTARLVSRGLERALAVERAHPVPPPLFAGSFRQTRIVAVSAGLVRDGARCRERRFRLVYPYLEIDAGNELRLILEADLVGLLVIVGPDSGYIELEGPDGCAEYLLWDEQCSYDRLGSVVFSPLVRAGAQVAIGVSERTVDHSGARRPVDPAASAVKRLKLIGLMMRS
jgi:hypothetical protein